MRAGTAATLVLSRFAAVPPAIAGDETTSLADTQAAIEANLRSPEGKAYDERLGADLFQKNHDALKKCRQGAARRLRASGCC